MNKKSKRKLQLRSQKELELTLGGEDLARAGETSSTDPALVTASGFAVISASGFAVISAAGFAVI